MTQARPLILIWLALLALLAISVAGSFVFSGLVNIAVSMGTAAIKAALIFWFYMHLREESWLLRIMAIGAVGWVALLFLLTGADYATRF